MIKPVPRQRRTHSPAFKAKLIAECAKPGASISAVSRAHKISDSLLRAWLRKSTGTILPSTRREPFATPPRIIPVQVAAPMESPHFIRIHLQQGNTHIHLEWPLDSVALCSDWLRGFLQ